MSRVPTLKRTDKVTKNKLKEESLPSMSKTSGIRGADEFDITDQEHHVLHKPAVYLGSIYKTERDVLVYGEDKSFEWKTTLMPRAIERVFLEVLENACDAIRKGRADGYDDGKPLEINITGKTITVKNGGSIPAVEQHKSGKGYVPYLIFFVLNTSDNYDENINTKEYSERKKNKDIAVRGRNGWGSKLASLFSLHFRARMADGKKEIFLESFNNNSDIKEPKVKKAKEQFAEVSYDLDLQRFDNYALDGYTTDDISIFRAHCIVAAYCNNIPVVFNGEKYGAMNIYGLSSLLFPNYKGKPIVGYHWGKDQEFTVSGKKKYLELPINGDLPLIEYAILVTPGQGKQISFVNGSMSIKGGTHVKGVYSAVSKILLKNLNTSTNKLNVNHIKNHVTIIVSCNIKGEPDMDSNAKLELMSPSFNVKIPERVKLALEATNIRNILQQELDNKITSGVVPTNRAKNMNHITKLTDAHLASVARSKRDKKPVILLLVEGQSAKNYALKYIEYDPEHYGVYPLKGKSINASRHSLEKVLSNPEIKDVMEIMGISEKGDYSKKEWLDKMRYDRVYFMGDNDPDGEHIKGLLVNLFVRLFPTFTDIQERTGIVAQAYMSVTIGKKRIVFYNYDEYRKWAKANPGLAKKHKPNYYKGLGSFSAAEIRRDMEERNIKEIPIEYDKKNRETLSLFFGKGRDDARKAWFAKFNYDDEAPPIGKTLKVSELINKRVILFTYASIMRGITGIDGLKEASRKATTAGLDIWKGGKTPKLIKVDGFAGHIKNTMSYEPDLKIIQNVIGRHTRNYPGTNNLRLFSAEGLFQDRKMEKDSQARYLKTTSPDWWPFMFHPEFFPLMERNLVQGELAEYKEIFTVAPLILMNTTAGTASTVNTKILGCLPIDVVDHIADLVQGNRPKTLKPGFVGFKGTVQVVPTSYLVGKDKKIGEPKPREEIDPSEQNLTDEEKLENYDKEVDPENIQGDDSALYSAIITGCFKVDNGVVEVTELPIKHTIFTYTKFLESLKQKGVIEDYKELCKDEDEGYTIKFLIWGMQNPDVYKLDLREVQKMSTMNVLIGREVKHFNTHDEIAKFWYERMIPNYEKRYQHKLTQTKENTVTYTQKSDFIKLYLSGKINITGKKRQEVENILKPYDIEYSRVKSMDIDHLTVETSSALIDKADNMMRELKILESKSGRDLWLEDLAALRHHLLNPPQKEE